jgi:hypothetical protein
MSDDARGREPGQAPLAALRRFVRPRAPVEMCDLCSVALAPEHQHLLDPASRQLLCACDACAILFSSQEGTKYRRLPRRLRMLTDFDVTDAQWDDLMIPVGMAFFFYHSGEGRVMAYYPSPAGPTESLLPLESWAELAQANPILAQMEPDTEALLVNRLKGAREYYLVPLDRSYELVGLIRTHWRGLSGGAAVWQELDQFFSRLRSVATPVSATPGARTAAAPPEAHA